MPAVEAEALTKRYSTNVAVDGISFTVERGSLFGFLGPNGSGKSTTVRMLCGLLAPSSGTARVGGLDPMESAKLLHHKIGYMAQGFALYPDLSCAENLEFCARAQGLKAADAREKKRHVAELTGVGRYYHTRAARLSGGWQRRLGLAAALLHDPEVLFLDEPTGGVDPVARRELWDLFAEMAQQGKTFFITTHDLDEAQHCSRVGYLLDGNLLACGSVDELRRGERTLEDGLIALVRGRRR